MGSAAAASFPFLLCFSLSLIFFSVYNPAFASPSPSPSVPVGAGMNPRFRRSLGLSPTPSPSPRASPSLGSSSFSSPTASPSSCSCSCSSPSPSPSPSVEQSPQLRFRADGTFKILQVADMHYANGNITKCLNVLRKQYPTCSDFNTTTFLQRMILAENPDFIIFTGDNIFAAETIDPVKSMLSAFAPAIESKLPWAAILGNHDQESRLSRGEVMKHIVGMENTLSQFNPESADIIDGFGNYNLEVGGVAGSSFENKSVLNLYFLDSGDYSTVRTAPGYDWIQPSQQFWYQQTSRKLKKSYMKEPESQKAAAPGLAYFHIPLPEFANLGSSDFKGVKQEGISSASINSGFFSTLLGEGDVKAVFSGHDHVNDFCGELAGIQLCYGGGFGYHAYGKAGWARRARVALMSLEMTEKGGWGGVESIRTWKRLDDEHLTTIDPQILWSKSSAGSWGMMLAAIATCLIIVCLILMFAVPENCIQPFMVSLKSLTSSCGKQYTRIETSVI